MSVIMCKNPLYLILTSAGIQEGPHWGSSQADEPAKLRNNVFTVNCY